MKSDLNQMRIFAHVVENEGFSAAARELGLPKSTVSRQVSSLEKRLGVRLMTRTTRRLHLTEAGVAYYETCRRVVADAEAADRLASGMMEEPAGCIVVTSPLDMGTHLLSPIFCSFLKKYPRIELDVRLQDRVSDMVKEGIDIAIRTGTLKDSRLMARRLGNMGT
ncbi:MAG: LysR family transcriptional regulator, partial [Candidatus Lindowbacteria bacterium]|nr:LysR family transcriptional regulator [Candidatus Lindowbacteria bacterium]